MQEITDSLNKISFPQIDIVIGIATGGTVPASLVAFKLNKPMQLIEINYRDEDNNPRYIDPALQNENIPDLKNKKILLVDDVSVSGKTLGYAKKLLSGNEITTFVMKGSADISLFPEIQSCVNWPWKLK